MLGDRKTNKIQVVQRRHLLDDIPRGRYAGYIGKPPDAYFESPENLTATESLRFDPVHNREAKLFLGVVDGEVITGPRLPDGRITRWVEGGVPLGISDDRHIVTIAGSRGGKGRSALIPNLILLPSATSFLCIDPKGDIARATARWRADGLGQQTGILDPFGVAGDALQRFHVAFNPIDVLLRSDQRTFVPNSKLIADSLITSGDVKDRHWDDCARSALSMLCSHVATHVNYEGYRKLVQVWHLISELATPDPNDPRRYWLEKELLANAAAGGTVRTAARQFYDRTGGEFSSVLSNLRKQTDWLGIECMHTCLCGPSIDFR
ncbi:MAG: type IV secretory system conjugative DNA transfer family protein, partial [Betaproteobacteria bacterium]